MSVIGGQCAQAETERQRQAELVQTLVNEVRRLRAEQHTCQQEIQRLRAEQFAFGDVPDDADATQHSVPAARSIVDESRLCSQVTRATWSDWSFKLRSYVSVVDMYLGRIMDEAELDSTRQHVATE